MIVPKHRIGYIDGLRAVAVLSVVACHCASIYPADFTQHPILWRTLLAGKHGVDLFFVLSGFCLAYPTLKRLREQGQSQLKWCPSQLKES